jgi:hypothetical protein
MNNFDDVKTVILGAGPSAFNSILKSALIRTSLVSIPVNSSCGSLVNLLQDESKINLDLVLGKLDSLFVPEPDNLVFEIKNYYLEFKDFDLSFLSSSFVDRNDNGVPDYVKFYGGICGKANLSYLYKHSSYKSR